MIRRHVVVWLAMLLWLSFIVVRETSQYGGSPEDTNWVRCSQTICIHALRFNGTFTGRRVMFNPSWNEASGRPSNRLGRRRRSLEALVAGTPTLAIQGGTIDTTLRPEVLTAMPEQPAEEAGQQSRAQTGGMSLIIPAILVSVASLLVSCAALLCVYEVHQRCLLEKMIQDKIVLSDQPSIQSSKLSLRPSFDVGSFNVKDLYYESVSNRSHCNAEAGHFPCLAECHSSVSCVSSVTHSLGGNEEASFDGIGYEKEQTELPAVASAIELNTVQLSDNGLRGKFNDHERFRGRAMLLVSEAPHQSFENNENRVRVELTHSSTPGTDESEVLIGGRFPPSKRPDDENQSAFIRDIVFLPLKQHESQSISVSDLGFELEDAQQSLSNPSVCSVANNSPLKGSIFEGDFVLAINSADTSGLSSANAFQLVADSLQSNSAPSHSVLMLTVLSMLRDDSESEGIESAEIIIANGSPNASPLADVEAVSMEI